MGPVYLHIYRRNNVSINCQSQNTLDLSLEMLSGRYIKRKNLALRLGAAAWCLGSFVLIQAYSSTLISFITTPNRKPIVNSIYDIPNVPGLKITVFKNFAVDVLIMVSDLPNFSIF